jgi:poly-gamma-glutamate synthesis protein (capsule biosynthesis protein)
MKKTITLLLLSLLISIVGFAQTSSNSTESLKMLFVGDIMGHGPQIKSAYNAKTKSYDYSPCFKYVKPIIESADLAIGNLELTLSDKGVYTGYPMFRSPDTLAHALKSAGFDVLTTSNNHSNDNRVYGVNHTIDVLRDLSFYQTGTFKNQAERDLYYPLIVYKNNFRLAFLNYTYDTNGLPTVEPTIVNVIDEEVIKKDLEFAKKLKPDAIIVIMHWGLEYQLNESLVQQDLAKKIFSWGGNLVIGAHPHVIQPIKNVAFTNEKGETETGLTVYSMGNFISNQKKYNTDGGLMVEIELTKKTGSNEAIVGKCEYIPVWRHINKVNAKNRYGTYEILPISAVENEVFPDLNLSSTAKAAMKKFGTRMRKHLAKHEGKERILTKENLKISQVETNNINNQRNPYARLASYKVTEVVENIDTTKPKLIVPIIDERYIISDNTEKATKIEPSTSPTKPRKETSTSTSKGFPEGSTEKTPIPLEYDNTENGYKPKINKSKVTDKYLVQIQTTRSLYTSNLPFENVIVKNVRGYFKYYLRAGDDLTTAKDVLEQVVKVGFGDAFIVKNKLNDVNATKGATEYGTEKDGLSIIYRIQFQSSTNLSVPKNLPFDDYQVIDENGRFRYFAGKADNLTEAMELIETLKTAGYKDCFVVQFQDGKPL